MFRRVYTPVRSETGSACSTRCTSSGKTQVALTRHHGVDEGELADDLGAHHAFAVGAPEDDEDPGIFFFQALRQRERGDLLLEHASEAHEPGPTARNVLDRFVQKRVDLSADAEQPIDEGFPGSVGIAGRPTSPQDVVDVRRLIETGRIEERRGKHPVAREVPHG